MPDWHLISMPDWHLIFDLEPCICPDWVHGPFYTPDWVPDWLFKPDWFMSNGQPLPEVYYLYGDKDNSEINKFEKMSENIQKYIKISQDFLFKFLCTLRSDLTSINCILDIYKSLLILRSENVLLKTRLLSLSFHSSSYYKHVLAVKRAKIQRRNKWNVQDILFRFFHSFIKMRIVIQTSEIQNKYILNVQSNSDAVGGGN